MILVPRVGLRTRSHATSGKPPTFSSWISSLIYFSYRDFFQNGRDPSPAGDIRKHSTRPSSLLRDHVLGEKQPNSIPFTFHPDHFEAGFPQASQNHHLWREPTHDSGFHSSWNSQDSQMKTRNRLPRASQSRRFWGIPFQAALCFI